MPVPPVSLHARPLAGFLALALLLPLGLLSTPTARAAIATGGVATVVTTEGDRLALRGGAGGGGRAGPGGRRSRGGRRHRRARPAHPRRRRPRRADLRLRPGRRGPPRRQRPAPRRRRRGLVRRRLRRRAGLGPRGAPV